MKNLGAMFALVSGYWERSRITLVHCLALALGIGAQYRDLHIFYATFDRGFPYPHSEQLVVLWSKSAGIIEHRTRSRPATIWIGRAKAGFPDPGSCQEWRIHLSIGEKPEQVLGDT